jgi:uncharacterized membrane-anchored protein YhcB (DUF1043 family)
MKTSILRALAVTSISLLAIPGCTNKRQEIKINKLEAELDELQEELNTTVEEKDNEFAAKDAEMLKMENETSEQIQQLTAERDKLNSELTDAKRQLERMEADRQASIPKDASTPGHADFDPAKETKYSHAMASIVGDVTSGTGFVVDIEGKRYLYTPAGTLAGNSRLAITNANGDKFTKFGDLEVADGCPFVRLELLEAGEVVALQLAASGAEMNSATKLACLGMTASTGSVTGELTNAFGQSADAIDMDPNALTGKVGGAVIETATGKVVGIVITPTADRAELWADTTPTSDVQLRASRVNRSPSWQPIPVATFLAESKRIADFDRLTKVAQALATVTVTSDRIVLDSAVGSSDTAKGVLAEAKDFPPAAEATLLDTQLSGKKLRIPGAEIKKRVLSMFASANGHLKRNADGFDPAKFCAFHRKPVENSIRWRKEAIERLIAANQAVSGTDVSPPPSDNKRDREQDGRR